MPGAEHIQSDALAIPFADRSFDLAMSNSVIEHVPDQAKFDAVVMRVGRRIYCQTPSKWFTVEPHYLGLFVHWLPERSFTHFVHHYLTIGCITPFVPETATSQFFDALGQGWIRAQSRALSVPFYDRLPGKCPVVALSKFGFRE